MSEEANEFAAIYAFVKTIPAGKVMSYGQVGREVGQNARTVGWAMAGVLDTDVPWQRVVGADGKMPIGKRGAFLENEQRKRLEQESVTFKENGAVDMARHQVGNESGPAEALTLEL